MFTENQQRSIYAIFFYTHISGAVADFPKKCVTYGNFILSSTLFCESCDYSDHALIYTVRAFVMNILNELFFYGKIDLLTSGFTFSIFEFRPTSKFALKCSLLHTEDI